MKARMKKLVDRMLGHSHLWTVARLLLATLLLTGLCEFLFWASAVELNLSLTDHWAIICYSFMASWWLVYFRSSKSRVPTLRLYLGQYSTAWLPLGSQAEVDFLELTQAMNTKCASSIQVQGIYIAVISLLLLYIVQVQEPSAFQTVLIRVAISSGLMAMLLLVISSDMLDTSSNRFLLQIGAESWAVKGRFYRGINPPGISNGYTYYGFAMFIFFIVVAISLIWPPLGGAGIAVLSYFGYPYWFGYRRVTDALGAERIEHDTVGWPSLLLGGFFMIGTLFIANLP